MEIVEQRDFLLRSGYSRIVIRNTDRVDDMSALEKSSMTRNTELITQVVDRSFDTYLYLME